MISLTRNPEGIYAIPLSISDETIAAAYGLTIADVKQARADRAKAAAQRERANIRISAAIDSIPMGINRDDENMRRGSAELLSPIQATEFYKRQQARVNG